MKFLFCLFVVGFIGYFSGLLLFGFRLFLLSLALFGPESTYRNTVEYRNVVSDALFKHAMGATVFVVCLFLWWFYNYGDAVL